MSVDLFELTLRGRMKAEAAAFDATLGPVPPLRTVLAPAVPVRRRPGRTLLRFGFAAAVAAVLLLGLASGWGNSTRSPAIGPLSSVALSPLPSTPTGAPSLIVPSASISSSPHIPSASLSWSPRSAISSGSAGIYRPAA
jgi:hypothetical protein